MSNQWGQSLRLSIFGESHGPGVGISIDGLPAGLAIDWPLLRRNLARRAPGGAFGSGRQEADQPQVLSGLFAEKTCGAPLTLWFANQDAAAADYPPGLLRPGQSDYPALRRHGQVLPGGGHFSGRLTAPLVAAGSIAAGWLQTRGVSIAAHLALLGPLEDSLWPALKIDPAGLPRLAEQALPFLDEYLVEEAEILLAEAREQVVSLGSAVEAVALGLPVGLGEPFFNSLESAIAALLFSIPGVKGVEFGDGFAFAAMDGAMARDGYYYQADGQLALADNHNGGILGGLSSGAPLLCRVAFKPTPSLAGGQSWVDSQAGKLVPAHPAGRHDPCLGVRGLVAVEAALALALMDAWLSAGYADA